ncbi:hypothetical protein BJY59DRAFT_520689 [Rhodotorula toruloides]
MLVVRRRSMAPPLPMTVLCRQRRTARQHTHLENHVDHPRLAFADVLRLLFGNLLLELLEEIGRVDRIFAEERIGTPAVLIEERVEVERELVGRRLVNMAKEGIVELGRRNVAAGDLVEEVVPDAETAGAPGTGAEEGEEGILSGLVGLLAGFVDRHDNALNRLLRALLGRLRLLSLRDGLDRLRAERASRRLRDRRHGYSLGACGGRAERPCRGGRLGRASGSCGELRRSTWTARGRRRLCFVVASVGGVVVGQRCERRVGGGSTVIRFAQRLLRLALDRLEGVSLRQPEHPQLRLLFQPLVLPVRRLIVAVSALRLVDHLPCALRRGSGGRAVVSVGGVGGVGRRAVQHRRRLVCPARVLMGRHSMRRGERVRRASEMRDITSIRGFCRRLSHFLAVSTCAQ